MLLALFPAVVQAALWRDFAPGELASRGFQSSEPLYYRSLKVDRDALLQRLAAAPREGTSSQAATLGLPMPYGDSQEFALEESPILAPALAARFPEIRTYRVRSITDPSVSGRLDMTPAGFHALLTTPAGTVFIDPDGSGGYRSYYKQDYAAAKGAEAPEHFCRLGELHAPGDEEHAPASLPAPAGRDLSGSVRRVYRLVVATTGEYGQHFGSRSAATSAIVTAINRVNQIYGRDLAIQLRITEALVYTNAGSDPYTDPANTGALLLENQENLDYRVGLDSYDIGHLFGLTGGGLAGLGVACTNSKAQGYTGYPSPVGDAFYIDFVAHEIGHQLNATHSFNGTTANCGGGNRWASTAVEPGSGTTIMAYAGICGGEDLQSHSDATFHAVSIQQIHDFAFSGAGSQCGTTSSTGNNLPAGVDAGADVTIPQGTPFVLTGAAGGDPDGDTLSYQWDEIDVGITATGTTNFRQDLGDNPLFRSFVPKGTPTRYFPRLSTLVAGGSEVGETLPTEARTLNFRMTVRDGNSGVADDDRAVTVTTAQGPFRISGGVLDGAGTYAGGSSQTLTWDPAGTAGDCPTLSVSLLSLSADHATYCDAGDDSRLDLGTVDNSTGTASVTLRSAQIAHARVMLKCADNVFFALSHNDFTVTAAGSAVAGNCKPIDGEALEHGTLFVDSGSSLTLSTSGSGGGGGGGLSWLPLLLGLGGLLRLRARGRGAD